MRPPAAVVVMAAPFAKAGSAWIVNACSDWRSAPLFRWMTSPVSASNLIGWSLVLTTQPIRYPLVHPSGGKFPATVFPLIVPNPAGFGILVVPSPGLNVIFSPPSNPTVAVTSKSLSGHTAEFGKVVAAGGHTQ